MIPHLGLSDIDEIVVLLAENYLHEHAPICQPCWNAGKGKQTPAHWTVDDKSVYSGFTTVCDNCRGGRAGKEDSRAPLFRKLQAFLRLAKEGKKG